jgi:di/tricarboxylate transporter
MEQLPKILLLVIVLVPLALVIANRLRMDLAALGMAAALGILQIAGLGMLGPAGTPNDAIKAISGFSQPVVITLLALFILTRGLDKSGITRWLAQRLVRAGRGRLNLMIALFAGTTALLSLFMNNLTAGALMLPSAMETARRTGIKPSKLLIPVAYGSLLGGTATYFTTANIIMSDLLRIANPPQAGLGILDFTPTGGLIAMAGILFLWLFGSKLLPDREPLDEQSLARLTGSDLEDFYQIGERLWEARVPTSSPLVNKTLADTGFGAKWGISIAAIRHEGEDYLLPAHNQMVHPGDVLLLVCREEKALMVREAGVEIQPAQSHEHLSTHGITFFELLLSPHSSVVGHTLKELDFRNRYGATVVALKRLTRSFRTDVGDLQLAFGDSLLVIANLEQVKTLKRTMDFIVIEPNPADQPVQRKSALLSGMIILAAIGVSVAGAPVYLCMLAGAVLLLLLKILSMEEAYQSIEWQAVFLIAGMYAVSLAMVHTGAADLVGKYLISLAAPFGGIGIAAGAYLLTALLTQVMGGQVTALVTGPVMISAALSMGVNPQAVAMATAIGCSASFLTPMAHPVNILMVAPANYRFTDFFRVGWMLTILSFLILLVGLRIFWGL